VKQILCLDDDRDTLKIYRAIIEDAGYEFVGTTDEDEALSILRRRTVHLFIQDVMRSGGIGGVKFLSMLKSKKALRRISVMMISAQPRETTAGQLKHEGMNIKRDLAGYFKKPFVIRDFLDLVHQILGERQKAPGVGGDGY